MFVVFGSKERQHISHFFHKAEIGNMLCINLLAFIAVTGFILKLDNVIGVRGSPHQALLCFVFWVQMKWGVLHREAHGQTIEWPLTVDIHCKIICLVFFHRERLPPLLISSYAFMYWEILHPFKRVGLFPWMNFGDQSILLFW